jgi:hypothetical protein
MIRHSRRHGRWAIMRAVIIRRFCKFIAMACMAELMRQYGFISLR